MNLFIGKRVVAVPPGGPDSHKFVPLFLLQVASHFAPPLQVRCVRVCVHPTADLVTSPMGTADCFDSSRTPPTDRRPLLLLLVFSVCYINMWYFHIFPVSSALYFVNVPGLWTYGRRLCVYALILHKISKVFCLFRLCLHKHVFRFLLSSAL